MGSQRARAACDGGSIYEDRSAFQDVERTARYEGMRLSGKMPSARRLRRKAVRCAYDARAACETGLRVRWRVSAAAPLTGTTARRGTRRVNEAGFKTTRFSIARATRAHSVSTHSVQFDFLHATRAVGSKGKAIQVTAVDL